MASSLDGIPGMSRTFAAFVQDVRVFIRDHAELNRLVGGEESSDRQIAWAVCDALSRFNGTPPLIGNFSLEDLLGQSQHYLIRRMTVVSLTESVGILMTRNHINYSDGGLSVGVNDKTPLLLQWLNIFRQVADQDMGRVKIALNIQGAMNSYGVVSEYWSVNGTYMGY